MKKFAAALAIGLILGLAAHSIAAFFPSTTVNVTAPASSGLVGALTIQPTASSANALSSCSSTVNYESWHVCKAAAGNLYRWQVTTNSVAGWFVVSDVTNPPSTNGVITNVKKCIYFPVNTSLADTWNPLPLGFSNGLTLLFTTGGCYKFQPSQTAFLSADFK